MARLTKKQEKSVLDGLTLMDDVFFTMCFDGSAECASVMLSVLLCRDDLAVTEATTHHAEVDRGRREAFREAGHIREGQGRNQGNHSVTERIYSL